MPRRAKPTEGPDPDLEDPTQRDHEAWAAGIAADYEAIMARLRARKGSDPVKARENVAGPLPGYPAGGARTTHMEARWRLKQERERRWQEDEQDE